MGRVAIWGAIRPGNMLLRAVSFSVLGCLGAYISVRDRCGEEGREW